MKRMIWLLILTLAVGIAVWMIGNHVVIAQQAPVKVTELLKADLEGMKGKELVVQLVELAPRGATGKHTHPAGHEVNYILEGSYIFEMEGHPPLTRQAGSAGYTPVSMAERGHEAKNASMTDPVKILVVRIHDKGQPLTVGITKPYLQ